MLFVCWGLRARQRRGHFAPGKKDASHRPWQGRRNVTQSEGASETSISSLVKANLSTMDFYTDLCFARPSESFSV